MFLDQAKKPEYQESTLADTDTHRKTPGLPKFQTRNLTFSMLAIFDEKLAFLLVTKLFKMYQSYVLKLFSVKAFYSLDSEREFGTTFL